MVFENPFDDNGRFISPSLNRVRIVDLPGYPLDNSYRNQTGYALLSKMALQLLVRENSRQLQLAPDKSSNLITLESCFSSNNLKVRTAAQSVAQEYGRRLGILLLTLKRGDVVNCTARPEWDARHWSLWAQIDKVWLGGGLVAGALGKLAAATAQTLLQEAGFFSYQVRQAENASFLPLVGLAQLAPSDATAMLLVDFGHTAVKRAVAFFQAGKMNRLQPLPSVPMPVAELQPGSPDARAEITAAFVVEVIVDAWKRAWQNDWPVCDLVAVSMACYLINGHPPASEIGVYGRLQFLTDHVQTYLAERLRAELKRPIDLQLFHDATAAALPYAGAQNTAVLMLGTAIGNGLAQFL